MMFIHLIWKRLIIDEVRFSFHGLSRHPPVAFYAKPNKKFANFCTGIAAPAATIDREVVTEFLLNKCSLTDRDIATAFRHLDRLLRVTSSQNMEEILGLLKGCGLTTPSQIRKVVLRNPVLFAYRSETNVKSKLSLLRSFMKEEDITKLVQSDARIFCRSERSLKSAISLLQKLGIEGDALSETLAREPRLLTNSEENVMESFKQAENSEFKKGSKMFAHVLRAILGLGKEKIDRRQHCLRSLGFSDKQISDILKKAPSILSCTEVKIKHNVDFVVKTAGLSLADLVKYPHLFQYSVETRMIPRYRLMEALKSMQMQAPTKKGKKEGLSFTNIVNLTEKRFLEKYVHSNAKSSLFLLDIYYGKKASCKVDHRQGDMQ